MHKEITDARLIVIKIGSSLLIDADGLNTGWLDGMAQDIAALRANGARVVVVSSGAVGLGAGQLGLARAAMTLEQSQAAAATGQIALARGWQEALAGLDIPIAQILLTIEDTEQRRRYLNARNTIHALLDLGAVPIINENDTVATQELRYGDNDRLAARVAGMVSADCLLLLSDIDGFYTSNPDTDTQGAAELIEEVSEMTAQLRAMAGGSGSTYGSGGMVTKLEAAEIAMRAGCHMVLTTGRPIRPLQALQNGGRSTLFRAADNPYGARKNWIAGSLQPSGSLHIDAGALDALHQGKSLLPVGIKSLEGQFERGDCVHIIGPQGETVGRGLSAYASTDALLIIGRPSSEISDILGFQGRAEMVHRDDLVMQMGENPL